MDDLARLCVAGDHQSVPGVPPANGGATLLAERAGQLAIHPYLRVIVYGGFEDDGSAGGVKPANALRNGDRDPVPVEADTTVRAPLSELGRANHFPSGVVEVPPPGVWPVVVGFYGIARRLTVRSR